MKIFREKKVIKLEELTENELYQLANEVSDVVQQDEINDSEGVEGIEEAMAGGMQMRSYESKKQAAIAAIAVSLAKKNNDPHYEMLKRYRHAWKKIKDEIVTRYRSQAEMKFQQNQSKSK